MGIVAVGETVLTGKDADDFLAGKHPLNEVLPVVQGTLVDNDAELGAKALEGIVDIGRPKATFSRWEGFSANEPEPDLMDGPRKMRGFEYKEALENILVHTHARNGTPEQDEQMLLAIRKIAQDVMGIPQEITAVGSHYFATEEAEAGIPIPEGEEE